LGSSSDEFLHLITQLLYIFASATVLLRNISVAGVREMEKTEQALKGWLKGFHLDDARLVAVTGLSRFYYEVSCKHLEGFFAGKGLATVHLFSYYSTEGKLPQPVHLNGQKISTLEELLNGDQIAVFFHDIEDLGSVQGFTSLVRAILERSSNPSTVIFTMRPATAFRVYGSGRSPLFGRVTRLEEPPVQELGIDDQYARSGGYLDLYRALILNERKVQEEIDIVVSESSVLFNVLDRFWKYLLTDSRRAGLCKVVASCLAAHDEPLRIPLIAEKCRVSQNTVRVLVYSANKTGLMRIGGSKAERVVELYPPLLHRWIRKNVPFNPTILRAKDG